MTVDNYEQVTYFPKGCAKSPRVLHQTVQLMSTHFPPDWLRVLVIISGRMVSLSSFGLFTNPSLPAAVQFLWIQHHYNASTLQPHYTLPRLFKMYVFSLLLACLEGRVTGPDRHGQWDQAWVQSLEPLGVYYKNLCLYSFFFKFYFKSTIEMINRWNKTRNYDVILTD